MKFRCMIVWNYWAKPLFERFVSTKVQRIDSVWWCWLVQKKPHYGPSDFFLSFCFWKGWNTHIGAHRRGVCVCRGGKIHRDAVSSPCCNSGNPYDKIKREKRIRVILDGLGEGVCVPACASLIENLHTLYRIKEWKTVNLPNDKNLWRMGNCCGGESGSKESFDTVAHLNKAQ